MTTNKKDLRATLLPYCLQRLPDGSYIALNRDYKPLGFIDCGWVRYEDYPARFHFVRKPSPATIRALSWNGSEDPAAIFFYNDGTVPFVGPPEATAAYLERLSRLARLTVYAEPKPGSHIDRLRELLRATIEQLQGDWWPNKFPEAATELRAALWLLDDSMGRPDAPLVVDLNARSMPPPELLPKVKELRVMVWGAWPRRWAIYDHIDQAEKTAELAACD